MIELMIAGLFVVIAGATGLALVDCWIRARYTLNCLQREHAMAAQGFLPVIGNVEPRPRARSDFAARTATRQSAHRSPSQRVVKHSPMRGAA